MATAPLTPKLAAIRAAMNPEQQAALDAALEERQAAARALRAPAEAAAAKQLKDLQAALDQAKQELAAITADRNNLLAAQKQLLAQSKATNAAKVALDPKYAANAKRGSDAFNAFVAEFNAVLAERAEFDLRFDAQAAAHIALTDAGEKLAALPENERTVALLKVKADSIAAELAKAQAAVAAAQPVHAAEPVAEATPVQAS